MSKKGFSLSLETVAIAIIILVVAFFIIFFILKYGGQLTFGIGQQAKSSTALLPNITGP